MRKRWMVLPGLIALLAMWFVIVNVSLADSPDPTKKIGDNVYYRVNGSTLEIYGSGSTWDFGDSYDETDSPFREYSGATYPADLSGVTKIVIGKDITCIGTYLFNQMNNDAITKVEFEKGSKLKTIKDEGMSTMSNNIDEIVLPEGFTTFAGNTAIGSQFNSIVLPKSFTTMSNSWELFYSLKEGGSVSFKNPNPESTCYLFEDIFVENGANWFNICNFTFYVPTEALEGYKTKYPDYANFFVGKDFPADEDPTGDNQVNTIYYTPLENQIAALGASIESDVNNESTGGSSNGGTTVTWNEGGALPLAVMQKLAENPNVTLEFTFTYEGVEHTVVIPAGTAIFDESIPWYGPEWLLTFYPEKGSTTSNGAYTIQPGDTLGSLARRLGTTVEKLMALNPYITDPGKIYVGDKFNY